MPEIRVAQIWEDTTDADRRFFVQRVVDGWVYGMAYKIHESATRDRKVHVSDFVEEWTLLEDTPARLLRAPDGGRR